MRIMTKYLGEVEVNEENIIHFQTGLPGFSDETSFTLLDMPGNPVFQVLQSINSANIAFIVTNPYHFYADYTVDLDDNILESLHIKTEDEVAILTIITVEDPFNKSTMNLKAPIIINSKRKLGKQYILNTDQYSMKTSISTFPMEKGE